MVWKFNLYKEKLAALDDKGGAIKYGELIELANDIQEICHRALAFNLCQNSIGSMAGYVAMMNAGVVPVMIAEDMDRSLLDALMRQYKPEYMWIPEERASEFSEMRIELKRYGYVLVSTNYGQESQLYKDLALLLTTSGSTGSPKLVRQSYQNIRANTESIVEYLKLDSTERPITTLPMNYTYGLSIINSHLYVGATILITDKTLVQKEFWHFLREEKATSFGGVPYTYEMLKKLRFFNMPNDSIRTMTQAGGKLSPELHREFAEYAKKTGKQFVVMYGQTEATARMAYLPAERSLDKYGSMGIAIPGGKFVLIDVEGEEIDKANVVGELVYEGKNVTLGYAMNREDLSKGDERLGKLVTGDMAKRDEEGFYYIVGRKKRFLKMFGKRVNLDEVDMLIKEEFVDMDCASTGSDDHMHIFVTDSEKLEDVKRFIVEKTHLNGVAVEVDAIEKVPRNEAGKVIYAELEKLFD